MSSMASPGKVTNSELMEILFGYLVFSGFDRVSALIGSFIFPDDKEDESKKKQRGAQIIQLVFIIIAIVFLFWHKFRV